MPDLASTQRAVLSLGANLGDPLGQLGSAVAALRATPGISVHALSPVFRTAPVGGVEQPEFFNIVVLIDTTLTPEELLARGHQIERDWGRRRVLVNGPRTLDIDIITMGSLEQSGPPMLPHPRAHQRGFVLIPWLAIDPDAELPGHRPVSELVAAIGHAGVELSAERLPTQEDS